MLQDFPDPLLCYYSCQLVGPLTFILLLTAKDLLFSLKEKLLNVFPQNIATVLNLIDHCIYYPSSDLGDRNLIAVPFNVSEGRSPFIGPSGFKVSLTSVIPTLIPVKIGP